MEIDIQTMEMSQSNQDFGLELEYECIDLCFIKEKQFLMQIIINEQLNFEVIVVDLSKENRILSFSLEIPLDNIINW